MPTYNNLLVEDKDQIRIIRFNRPKALNALNIETLEELLDLLQQTRAEQTIGAIVLTGEGKAFIAGADISVMAEFSVTEARVFAALGHRVLSTLEAMSCPVIAAVNGFALGGGTEVSLGCDFVYASPKAVFGQPEVGLGLIPGFGGTQRLSRKVGPAMARELIFTGNHIPAEEALRMGLVNKIVPADELLEVTLETARTILKRAPLAVAACKRVMTQGHDLPLSTACDLEMQEFALLFDSQDQKEGTRAFLEKRTPAFQNK